MRQAILCLAIAGALAAGAACAGAQAGAMPPMDGMRMIPPPDQLPVPVRMTGIGNSHIAIKASPLRAFAQLARLAGVAIPPLR